MTSVVFTGPCIIVGTTIARADLIDACIDAGIDCPVSLTKDVTWLVQSRTDTVKFKKAMDWKIPVCSYPWFIETFKLQIEHKHEPHSVVDVMPEVPDFTLTGPGCLL